MNNLTGRQIDNYRIDEQLGAGGMGAVYKAYDLNLGRPVALKVMHGQYATNPKFQQRFMQEAKAAARLQHPSIVPIHHFGQMDDLLYMIMAFISGPSLSAHVQQMEQRGIMLNLRETLYLLAQVADALGYAHQQGVIHRDIKPDNVVLEKLDAPERPGEPPLRALVADFGLAKLMQGGIQTQTGMFMGTLPYMSPEQCLGRPLDGRSDIYSLGIVLYQLATGKLPFDIQSPTDAVVKHMKETPPRPCAIQTKLDRKVEALILKAIAKRPAERVQKAEQLAHAMRQVAAGLSEAQATQFTSHGTVVSLVTQFHPLSDFQQPTQLGKSLVVSGGSDQLVIARQGEAPRAHPLDKQTLTLGRGPDNDVVLNASGISRQHVRLERSTLGWQVTDLGSTNGTFLNRTQLQPHVPQAWETQQALQIGPFFLHWQKAGQPSVMHSARHSYQATNLARPVPTGATQIHSQTGQLSITVNPTDLDVEPGQSTKVSVEIFNQGMTVDHYQISVADLPAKWVALPQDSVQLMPGEQTALSLEIHPPRNSDTPAGPYPYRLMLRSTSDQREVASVPGTVTVAPFEQFNLEVHPTRLQPGQQSHVQIRNDGNVETAYRIIGRDGADALLFKSEKGRVKLAPGAMQTVPLTVAAKDQPVFGTPQIHPFEIVVTSTAGEQQMKTGQLEVQPMLPRWALPAGGLLALLMCLSLALLIPWLSQGGTTGIMGGLFGPGGGAADPAATGAPLLETTATAAAATQVAATATAAAQIQIAATQTADAAQLAGDADADGLSDTREAELGTDPNNTDTDGDGLSDGREVNEHDTQPRNQDTDGDTLTDGAEANDHGTSPLLADTDGDGVPDGTELAAGTDPLRPPPTATPTPTAAPTSTPSSPPAAIASPSAPAGAAPPNQAPVAKPSANPISGAAPLNVSFDASASTDDGSIAGYAWNFGDGSSGSGVTTSHTYNAAGDYTATLAVTDDKGLTHSATVNITVSSTPNVPPVANFTANPLSGTVPLEVTFDASNSQDSDGLITAYTWDFGDGTTGTGATASHTYATAGNFPVTLTVTDDAGASHAATVHIAANALANTPPTASFTLHPDSGAAPLSVTFDATGSTDDGNITAYTWDFGDGTAGSGETTAHTYTRGGTFNVRLTVTDDDGATAESTQAISANTLPTAAFTASPTFGTFPLTVDFDASASSDSDGDALAYSWDFGDGNVGSGSTVSHVYTAEGTFTVTLTVSDGNGGTDAHSETIHVMHPTVTPTLTPTSTFVPPPSPTPTLAP